LPLERKSKTWLNKSSLLSVTVKLLERTETGQALMINIEQNRERNQAVDEATQRSRLVNPQQHDCFGCTAGAGSSCSGAIV
jgi:mannitol-specific phosphotransferase system IIBC component